MKINSLVQLNIKLAFLLLLGMGSYMQVGAQKPTGLPSYAANAPLNYVRSWEATAPFADTAGFATKPLTEVKEATQYFDGLGRPLQTVIKKGSMVTTDLMNVNTDADNAKDLVTPVLYDGYGREVYKFLPFAATDNDGVFKNNPYTQQNNFMATQYGNQGNDGQYGYSQTVFESSPLNRTLEQYAPGESWAGSIATSKHSIKSNYWINTGLDGVRIWNVTNGTIGSGVGSVQANITVSSRTATPPPYVATNSITFTNGFESQPGDNFTASIVTGGGAPTDLITSTYTSPGYYPEGQLYKNVVKDEHGKQVIEFLDKDGKVILKKVQLTAAADGGGGSDHTGWICTYYIYDDLGNLRCVIQPEGVKQLATNGWQLTATIRSEQCFLYEYDYRNRMIVKKVPGAAEVTMVYDVRDRLVMTQDGNLRNDPNGSLWNFIQYDELNRPVKTGIIAAAANPNTHWDAADALKSGTNNEAIRYPTIDLLLNATALTETFYDTYGWITANNITGIDGNYSTIHNGQLYNSNSSSNTSFPFHKQNVQDTRTKGMVTGTRTQVLGTGTYITATTIYDDKERPIQVKSINHTGGIDIATTQYSWSGQPLITLSEQHKTDGSPVGATKGILTITKNSYDALGRVTQTTKNIMDYDSPGIQSGDQVMAQNYYDALGQLKTKSIGRRYDAPLQAVETQNYEYNIRGWLLGVNRDYVKNASTAYNFGFDLAYDKTNNNNTGVSYGSVNNYANAFYNGNIAGMTWRGKTGSTDIRRYDYVYDAANRIINADFKDYNGSTFTATGNFSSLMGDGNPLNPNQAYDLNGNILSMTQYGLYGGIKTTIDQLTYSYIAGSNKLLKVKDDQTSNYQLGDFHDGTNGDNNDYAYDVNGNLTQDLNKGINSISYNILNLPQTITVTNKGTITYLYDAAGNKLSKTVNETGQVAKTTQYLGGMIFENNVLQHVATEEGRVRLSSGQWRYDYFLKDHLGNVRVMLSDNGDPLEETHYYPFGLTQKGISSQQLTASLQNKYKFNGIEESTDLGLNQYDAFFRTMDPQLGRWWQADPRASDWESPYAAMGNNPIGNLDPLGDTTINGQAYENFVDGEWLENVTVIGKGRPRQNSVVSNLASGAWQAVKDNIQGVIDEFRPERILSKLNQSEFLMNELINTGKGLIDLASQMRSWNQEQWERGGGYITATAAISLLTRKAGGQRLLIAGRLHKHHVLPNQFRKWFAQRGISNIDDYTVQIGQSTHLKGIHGKGLGSQLPGNWNKQWADFIKNNPNASPSEIFHHAEGLLKTYGLEHLPYTPYK
ncbi:DUF6443 domain-containing protein [Niabella sp. 22666]|uniref:DUF6443 domain-containing protein n=1 Tax=Niabella sp. 22666 TaxID=3453954 RepID=UPI003F84BF9F